MLATKSGTNQLHGSVFETFRTNAAGLRARQRQDGNSSAKLIRNEFGASAGGPVYVPQAASTDAIARSGSSPTKGMRQRQATFDEDYVPTPQMFNGDFSNIFDNNGVQTHIYDPLTTDAQGRRTAFPGDIIPTNRISPFFGVMRSITHTPTNPSDPFQSPNLDTFYPNNNNTDTLTAKGDHRFSSADSLSGRFTRSRATSLLAGGRFGSPAEGLTNGFGTGRTDTHVYNTTDHGDARLRAELPQRTADRSQSQSERAGYSCRFHQLVAATGPAQSVRCGGLADDQRRQLPGQ